MRKAIKLPPSRHFHYGVWGLLFLNVLLFGDVFWGTGHRLLSSSQADLFLHFAAWRQFAFDELRQGHLALWNPHYLCGAPFLGNFESALLYPLNWHYLFLPLDLAINLGIVVHVFLAGFFTYLWASHRGLPPLASFVSGVVFMFGGAYFLHLHAGHLPNLCAMVWAPLIFLALDELFDRFAVKWILIGIFAVSMQILAGHPQYVYFTAICAALYTILNLRGHKAKLKSLGAFVLVYLSASLVTTVQLWTGIQTALECARDIPLEYRSAASFSFPPENLITLALPEFFGNLTTTHYWGRWYLWEVSLFIGVTALVLVLAALSAGKRRWAFSMVVIPFVFALGAYTPLFHLFYNYMPMFKGMRGICKFDFISSLFLALLAGMGLNYLIQIKTKSQKLVFLTLGLGFLFVSLGSTILVLTHGGHGSRVFGRLSWLAQAFSTMDPASQEAYAAQSGTHAAFSLGLGALTCFALAGLLVFQRSNSKMIYGVVGLAVLELFVFARSNRPTFEMAELRGQYERIQNFYSRTPGDYRVYGTGGASLVTGGRDIWEDEPMVLKRYARFVCYSQGIEENKLFSTSPLFKKFNKTFALARLKYILSNEPNGLKVYPVLFKTLPRMSLVDGWEKAEDGPRALGAIFDPKFDPFRNVILETDPVPAPVPGTSKGNLRWKDLSTDEIEIQADIPRPSLLLVTDNYSRGWKAEAFSDS